MSEQLTIFLGVFDLAEAKRFRSDLAKYGVEIEFKTNEQTCTRGCKVTVEVWGEDKDLNTFQQYFGSEMQRDLAGHTVNTEALSAVFDPNADKVQCQACASWFAPTEKECPECGLFYG